MKDIENLKNNLENINNEDLLKSLDSIDEKYKSLEDKVLRTYAEFDNFKKRTEREKSETTKIVTEKIIVSFLPIIDDLERSLEFITDENVKSGNEMILNKLLNILESNNVKKIDSLNNKFDDKIHEALSMIDAGVENVDIVVKELESGYVLNNKVIRYSKVIVGK
jgi:molecular chaperone GrpE